MPVFKGRKDVFRLFVCFVLFSARLPAVAQRILPGQVTDESDQALAGAWVLWPGTTERFPTDGTGHFSIPHPDTNAVYLVAGCPGFQTDTFEIKGHAFAYIQLTLVSKQLADVHVVRKRAGTFIDPLQTIKTEVITQKELTKAACCDMAGCFETQGSVQPQTTNVLTQSKELRILGLSGVYNQILVDGLPLMQGLPFTYGVSTIPASIIDKIFVSKGAGSVLQGFEGITGQINVVTRDPEKEPRWFGNAYLNAFGEQHSNANYAGKTDTAGTWRTFLSVHAVQPANRRDRDADGFLDVPKLRRVSVFNRWQYGKENEKGFFAHLSGRLTQENRVGGQRFFDPARDKGSSRMYGQTMDAFQPEAVVKTGYRASARHAWQFQASAFGQRQASWFGTLRYRASQESLIGWLQHQYRYGTENSLTSGISYRYQELRETISFSDTLPRRNFAGRYQTSLRIPGLFAENKALLAGGRLTWIAGLRLDHLNGRGFFLTPRSLVKWDLHPAHAIRASVGSGWRPVHVFPENITLLASSRDVVWLENLRPEQALNWGGSYTWTLDYKTLSGTVSLDFYQTRFQNQFFPDFTRQAGVAFLGNFTGKSRANSAQAEANLKYREWLELRLVYNYLDVYRVENGVREVLPFNPPHRGVVAVSYRPLSDRFFVDLNFHAYDRQRLPLTRASTGEPGPEFSRPYQVWNLQLTWKTGPWEWYAGMENILDFRQRQPIADWQHPFGPNFDTGTVWGPTRGRETYLGVRWRSRK